MDNDDPGTADDPGAADEPAAQPAPQRDKERTRAAILDAAASMIVEHGSGVRCCGSEPRDRKSVV